MKLNIIKEFDKIAPKLYKFNNEFRTRKFKETDYFKEILQFLSNETYWNRHYGKINGKVLNNKHNFFVKIGLYKELYKSILEKYFYKNKTKKLKYQSIDTSFVMNKQGFASKLGRNKYYKGKRGLKICSIVDSNGITIGFFICNGSIHDSKIVSNLIDNTLINTETLKFKNHNRYKQYMLADMGFDSNFIRKLFLEKGYEPIIPHNIRNNKFQKKVKLTPFEKEKYKKRLIIENSYSWLKSYPVLDKMYQKTFSSYNGLFYLASSVLLINKMIHYNL